MSNLVEVEIKQQIATLYLNRADKRNALNIELFQLLAAQIKQLKKNKKIRAIIIAANGEDFCSGLDIKSVMSNKAAAIKLLWKWHPWQANLAQIVSSGWRDIPVPVIAAIHGRCWGGGMQIALGADFRIAHPQASLSIMESHWGLCPDMAGTLGLRENMPLDQALMLTMTAEQISAETALQQQLVTELSDDPLQRATELATQLCSKSPDALAAIKRCYHKAWHEDDNKVLGRETISQIKILMGKNQRHATKIAQGKEASYQSRGNW